MPTRFIRCKNADRIPSGMRLVRFDGRQDRLGATKALNGIARDRLVLNLLGFPSVVLIQDAGGNGGQHLMGRACSLDLRARVAALRRVRAAGR